MSGPDYQRRQRAEQALLAATARLAEARLRSDPAASFGPLGEVLMWIVVLDGWHEGAGGGAYRQRRDADPAGQTVRGHRYVRNRLIHQEAITDLVEVIPGMVFPMVFPMVFHEVRWKALAALPAPDRPDPQGAQVYAGYLQGQLVRVTTPAVVSFLMRQP